MPMAHVRGLVLDFDGLIMDSELVWKSVLEELYARHDVSFCESAWRSGVGASLAEYDPFGEIAAAAGDPGKRAAVEAEGERMFRAAMADAVLLPGVARLLTDAIRRGMRIAIASSSRRESVEPYLQRLGVLSSFDHVVTADDVRDVKPAPELYHTALVRLRLDAPEVVAFEDSPAGLESSRRAGIRCIVVPSEATRGLSFDGCLMELPSLTQFSLGMIPGC